MRLSREHFFDLVELVGKAIATARQRPVDASWVDGISPGWLQGRPKPKPPLKSPGNDEFGLFNGTPWAGLEDSERTDLETVAPGAGDFGFAEPEKRKARLTKDDFGDSAARQLWEIQRQVRFKLTTVTDGLDQLRALCDRMQAVQFVSAGWSTMVRAVMDKRCL
jgi:hypothetical protein